MVKSYINLNLESVEAVLIFDSEGNRLLSKYYKPQESKFEKLLYEKTKKSPAEVILFQGRIVVIKPLVDIICYIVGGTDENEIMLVHLMESFTTALTQVLKYLQFIRIQVDKKALMENFDMVLICLDELVDDG